MSTNSYPGPNNITRERLSNGAVVLVYENFSSATVVVQGILRAGALADGEGKAGLADYTSDLLMRGTKSRNFEEIYEILESIGASLSFGSGRHATYFSSYSLIEDFDLMLDMVNQSLCHPVFPVTEVELIRGQIITGLQMRANNTGQMARLAFNEALYPNHPYGRSISGHIETIETISRNDLVDFHRRYYGPRDMIITVVGALPAATVIEKLEEAFGRWQNDGQVALPEVGEMARPSQRLRTDVAMPKKSQSDIIMGLPGPRRSAGDYLDASLMNTILGVFGMMGRIGQSVREEQGLAYYAYSRLESGLGPGPWLATAGVAPDNVEVAIESITAEIRRMRDELVTDEELADSQAYRTGSLPVGLETNGALASTISDMELYGLGLDYLQRYTDLINEITRERVLAAARKYLSEEQMVVAVAGP